MEASNYVRCVWRRSSSADVISHMPRDRALLAWRLLVIGGPKASKQRVTLGFMGYLVRLSLI